MARRIVDGEAPDVPLEAAKIVGTLSQQALDIHVRLRQIDPDRLVWQRGNDVARRLMTSPALVRLERRHLPHRSPTRTSVPLGATVRRLVETDTTSEVDRLQRAAWAYHQDGRQVAAQAPHCRHDFVRATRKARSSGNQPTTGQSARAKARTGRNCCHGKQDSTDYLGNHDTWRDLSCRLPAGTGRI